MKLFKSFLIFSMCAAIAASCTIEIQETAPAGTDGAVTVMQVNLPDTKTALSEPEAGVRKVTWLEGNTLMLNGDESDPLAALYDGETSAEFVWQGDLSAPYRALYPASIYKDASTIKLPFSQNKMPGADNIADDTFPMCGYSASSTGMSLVYPCAIVKLRIQLPSDGTKITYVEFKGNANEQVSGDFTLDYQTGALTSASSNTLSKTVRAFSIKEGNSGDVEICNVVVPAGTYASGFTVKVVGSDGKYMEKATASSKTLEGGHSYAFPAFTYAPTDDMDALPISTAEEFVAFAQDWNAGRFEGTKCNIYLTTDIVFDETTSAAFVATGGIGTGTNPITGDSNHYNGTVSGNGFSICDLTSTVPVFAFTGGACVINELNLDASCTFTCAAGGSADFGAFGGRFKGEMNDCHCYADINVKGNSLSAERYIGGLAGRFYDGDATDCSMDGDIVLASGGSYTENILYVGGIGGAIQGASKSVLTRCEMNGKIRLVGSGEFDGPTFASYIFAGGIVGDATKGTVNNCSTDSGAEVSLHGTFKPNIGGIAGIVRENGTIKDCDNAAALEFKSNGARANTTPTYVGGIAGANGNSSVTGGTIQGCTNNGAISSKCNSTTLALAGIAAFNNGTMGDCVNNGNILRQAQLTNAQANRYISLGGAVGTFKSGSVSHVENNGNVTFQEPGTSTLTTVAMGGIVARINEGSAAVTISNCSNSGTIYENGGSDVTLTAWKATAGIVGYVGQPATISQCSNTGSVQFSYNTKANGRSSYVGGIAGVCGVYDTERGWGTITGVTIQNCTNYGKVQNQNFNNTYNSAQGAVCGGIAGMLYGDSGNKIVVTNCDNVSMAGYTSDMISKRGYQGGIVGYASYVNISNCTSTKNVSSSIPRYCGGIVGQLEASSVSNCTVQGNTLLGSKSAACDMGGIAGTMDASSSITSCDVINVKLAYDQQANFSWGAIAGTTAAGASITDCQLSGGYSIDNGSTYTPFATINDDVSFDGNATMSGNSLYSPDYDITGTVSCGGSPLAGVVVSDGFQSVLTGSDGKYYIKKDANATCVSVSIPSGYMPAISGGLAAFYKKLSTVTPAAGIYTVDFPMNAVSNPDEFTILVYADVQIRGTSEWGDNVVFKSSAVAKDVFTDLQDVATSKGGNVIGLSLGDQVNYAKAGEFDLYLDSDRLGKLDFANFCIPGNHDYQDGTYDTFIEAIAKYESVFSPSRYSFNYGKIHFVMVDNARRANVESEGKGLPDPAWQWLQSDLKYVPKSTPIIICSHQPLFTESYHDTYNDSYRKRDISTRDWCLNPGYASLLASYKHVYAFNGDLHAMFNDVYTSGDKTNIEVHGLPRATGALWLNQFISICGTPRGYLVMDVNGTDVTYKFHPVKYQTAGTVSGGVAPSPMTYRDFSITDGVFYMKNGYLSNPGAQLGDFYQIHAYAPGVYTRNEGAYENDVLATVFMYDPRWSDVTFEYAGGSMKMEQLPISAGVHDPGFTWLYDFYYENYPRADKSYWQGQFKNEWGSYNIFRCTPPSGVTSGTVKVTDHFGNNYEYKLSW